MATRFGPDPLLDELETQRLEFEAQFGGDRKKIAEYYMEYQKQFADRLVTSGAAGLRDGTRGGKARKVGRGICIEPGSGRHWRGIERGEAPEQPRRAPRLVIDAEVRVVQQRAHRLA